MAKAPKFDQALLDLEALSKRYGALLELGESIQEVQVLLNQKASLEAAVAALSDQLIKQKDDLAQVQLGLKKADEDQEAARKAMASEVKAHEVAISAAQAKLTGFQKEYEAKLADAAAEANAIVAKAKAEADAIKGRSETLVAQANDKLVNLQNKIDAIKASLNG